MSRGAATSTSSEAADAARASLEAGRSAVDAVVAGFFAAAGADPGILLAPAVALVAGAGAGARAFDGRSAQPGRGGARPRGFVAEAEIPETATVAAPRTLPMLALLHTRHGRAPLRELARPGVLAAERAGSKERAELLQRVGSSGAAALHAEAIVGAAVALAGATTGGLLTREDWLEAGSFDDAALDVAGERTRAVLVPAAWRARNDGASVTCIVACDGRGLLAALAVEPISPSDGLELTGAGVRLPRGAEAVRRGVPRLAPGALLPLRAPIALVTGPEGVSLAFGLDAAVLAEADFDALFDGTALELSLGRLSEALAVRAVAVSSDPRTARVVATG